MNDSSNVEVYKEAHTVTQEDHDAGLYLAVEVGDTIVFVVQETTTVSREVIDVEGVPTLEVEADVPKKKASKGNKITAIGESGDSTVSDTVVA